MSRCSEKGKESNEIPGDGEVIDSLTVCGVADIGLLPRMVSLPRSLWGKSEEAYWVLVNQTGLHDGRTDAYETEMRPRLRM